MLVILVESLKQQEIFNVLQHLVIDATQGRGSCEPESFAVIIILVVVLPDPGSLLHAIELVSNMQRLLTP